MRRFAGLGVIVLAVAITAAPMLYVGKSLAKRWSMHLQQRPAAESGTRAGGFSEGSRYTLPGWLVVLGAGLIISSGRIPRMLRAGTRTRPSLLGIDEKEQARTREHRHEPGKRSSPPFSFDPALLTKHAWSGRSGAPDKTLSA